MPQNPYDDFVNMIGGAVKPVAQAGDWMAQNPPGDYIKGLLHGLIHMNNMQKMQQPRQLGDVNLPADPRNAAADKRAKRKGARPAQTLPGVQPVGQD